MKEGTRRVLLGVWNLAVFAAVLLAWLWMILYGYGERLSDVGMRSLRYYTVLSNFFEAFASLGMGLALLCGAQKSLRFWQAVKLAAASCVLVTFWVVLLFLGGVYGYPAMIRGANLWFHLIVPVAAALEYALFDRFGNIPLPQTLFCLLPTLVYGVFYAVNVLAFQGEDFYHFVTWGAGPGCVIAFLIFSLQFGMICLLRKLNQRRKKT